MFDREWLPAGALGLGEWVLSSILPGRYLLINRRCTQHQFLLRRSQVTNHNIQFSAAPSPPVDQVPSSAPSQWLRRPFRHAARCLR